MGKFDVFLKANRVQKPNFKYAPTKNFVDENGKPIEWEFKRLTTGEERLIKESCMLGGKFNSLSYIRKLIAASVVYPDLNNIELQESYGVYTPEELLEELVNSPGEWGELSIKIQKELDLINLDEAISDAKN